MIVLCVRGFVIAQLLYVIQALNSPYQIYDMVQQDICKMRRFPLLDSFLSQTDSILLANPERGAIFRQSWNSSSFKRYSDCKFYIQAPPRMGLYVTVANVQLRKNTRGNCIDSIVVKKSNEKKYEFCDDKEDDEPRVFSDDLGRMRITVNLDSTLPLPTLEDTLEVQLIVTVKGRCNLEGYVPCEDDEDDSCISKNFFGDGIINCPECADENGCLIDSVQTPVVNPSNIFLSALVSLFATAIVCGGCLWCLCKHRRCIDNCNSNSSGTGRSNRDSMVAVDQLHVDLHPPVIPSNEATPSAPPEENKDLPPSYESLFPIGSISR
ncbi:uncharacterized protein LOC129764292 [Toxorhynchites rutilus septentrionalis]|uniref:uncharacterized protein LOC129764292 n=1 Tax=Toxorhynchites rutilus septentrionalis TaxID=329112 RepID=UPI002479ADE5|nr:uncharacterized protein LOC129764292 [Toxorhynchites rutilus septentrionalis]